MDINVLNQEQGIKKIAQLICDRNLIPVFGSGFTKDSNASGGRVPDGKEATELMKNILKEKYREISDSTIENWDFNQTSKYFYDLAPKEVKNKFFRKYFTDVVIGDTKKKILEFEWPYAYTLNIDDGIERTQTFNPVLPYKDLNYPETSIKLLYKLHGDAFTEVAYKTKQNIVFSTDQYIQSISSEENGDFLKNLVADFSKNNLIFIGCSLINEPDLKYVYGKSEHNTGTLKILLASKEPNFIQKIQLKDYGINTIIIADDYDLFYRQLINEVSEISALEGILTYRYKNPKVIVKDEKEETIKYLAGSNIFDNKRNCFFKGGMHVKRSCINDIINELENKNCVIIKGRRFCGKTFLLATCCEMMKQYTIYYFPSNTTADEQVVFKLLHDSSNSLFIFDSNSLSGNAYKLISNSTTLLEKQGNKLIIAINSNDNFIVDMLNAGYIEVSSYFKDEELKDNRILSCKYALRERFYKNSNLDYLQKLSETQKIEVSLFNNLPYKISFKEKILLLLLCSQDKIFTGDILALGITSIEIRDFLQRFPILVEEISVDDSERSHHSSTKIVHNSKVTLLLMLEKFNTNDKLKCIEYIVKKLKGDSERERIYINIILFDSLNQLFGGKKGAGHLIFDIYERLEPLLSESLHYWLQRAKSIYRILPNNYEELRKAYWDAKKVYYDGWPTIRSKAALTTSLICCLLYDLEKEEYTKKQYIEEALQLAHEAFFSKYYFNNRFLKSELNSGRRHNKSYKLLKDLCETYLQVYLDGDLLNYVSDLKEKLDEVEKESIHRCNHTKFLTYA